MVLKKTLESYLDSQEIKPVHPQGNQPLDFLGRDDAEAKLHYFGHLMQRAKSGLMHDTGCLGLVHWDDPEGCYGGEEGGGFRMEIGRAHV